MDNLTHSLVGLTAAKAGLERLSPWATTVCVISANAADADFVSLFFGDRWTLLQHHRGITHSIIGTIAIGFSIPVLVYIVERVISRLRRNAWLRYTLKIHPQSLPLTTWPQKRARCYRTIHSCLSFSDG